MRTRFDEVSGEVVGAVRAGATVEDAARISGVSAGTVRGWLKRGRREPGTRFAGFVAEIEAARSERAADGSPLTREEFDSCLARAVRGGSVQAMRLWASLNADAEPERPSGDVFARFDELAARRQHA